jgi:DNA repair protein RecN (Recombination protein N)
VIEELHIRSLGVIEDVSLELAPGLTVVTGETGAGKTMLVTALELLLGARASADLVRTGSAAAHIEAVLLAPDQAALARQQQMAQRDHGTDAPADATIDGPVVEQDPWADAEDGLLIVGRELAVSGRSKARIGGRLVPVSGLSSLLAGHVEVHGQHEHIRLERADVQRALLDRFAGEPHQELLASYRAAYRHWRTLVARRAAVSSGVQERERRVAQLESELAAITGMAIDLARDAGLEAELDVRMNAEELRRQAEAARTALAEGAAADGIAQALVALRRLPVPDAVLQDLEARVASVSREVGELVVDLATYASSVEVDETELDRLQTRRRDLDGLRRRFGPDLAAVVAYGEAAQQELADLLLLGADAEGLDGQVANALAEARRCGAALTQSRRRAAEDLAVLVGGHLADLALAHATVEIRVEGRDGAEPGPEGLDEVVFLLAANPGERPARLGAGASGGERSRVALAIEVALAEVDDAAVLVFDEVDAGIGGSTAIAVGQKLARLASSGPRPRQVLCVTHLAQVAAFADVHHVVEKQVRDGRTVTTVRRVADEDRVEELSRMLGGEATAEAGLDHARGLLAAARQRVAPVG